MMLMATMFLLLLYGCQEESLPDEGGEIPLHFVPKDAGYMRLPLIGTRWKLVGFADKEQNSIKLTTPFRDKSYTLLFKENSELEGFTSSNVVWRTYSFHPASENGLDLSSFGPSTYAGESEEGYLYIELMKRLTPSGFPPGDWSFIMIRSNICCSSQWTERLFASI